MRPSFRSDSILSQSCGELCTLLAVPYSQWCLFLGTTTFSSGDGQPQGLAWKLQNHITHASARFFSWQAPVHSVKTKPHLGGMAVVFGGNPEGPQIWAFRRILRVKQISRDRVSKGSTLPWHPRTGLRQSLMAPFTAPLPSGMQSSQAGGCKVHSQTKASLPVSL